MVVAKTIVIGFVVVFGCITMAASDVQTIENARDEFSKGQFQKAIELYSDIPASSDFWLDAIEERAWSYTRLGQYESALADLHSVTSPVWSSQVGPETYMLSTFVSLKICAYKDVAKKINIFKQRLLPRVATLEKLVTKPITEDFLAMAEQLKKNQVTMMSLGKNAENYPRFFFRDKILLKHLQMNNQTEVARRMKQLAQDDLKEIGLNLKKMKIIDVELIQKILLADQNSNLKKSSELNFSAVDRSQKMIFPVTDDEVWVDEVGHFQVKADQCATLTKGSL